MLFAIAVGRMSAQNGAQRQDVLSKALVHIFFHKVASCVRHFHYFMQTTSPTRKTTFYNRWFLAHVGVTLRCASAVHAHNNKKFVREFVMELALVVVLLLLGIAVKLIYLVVYSWWSGHYPTVVHHPDSVLCKIVAESCPTLQNP